MNPQMTQLESEYLASLQAAEALGARMVSHGHTATRPINLSFTNLQQATLWVAKDIEEKKMRERTDDVLAAADAPVDPDPPKEES